MTPPATVVIEAGLIAFYNYLPKMAKMDKSCTILEHEVSPTTEEVIKIK